LKSEIVISRRTGIERLSQDYFPNQACIDSSALVIRFRPEVMRTGGRAMIAERYTPTCLEWLVLQMQAAVPMLLSQARMLLNLKDVDDIRVFFSAKEPDTVVGTLRHLKGVPEDVVTALRKEIDRETMERAKAHGWGGWVKIQWDVRGPA